MPRKSALRTGFGVGVVGALLILAPAASARGGEKEPPSLAAFKSFLKKTFPDKKWQVGPKQLDTPETQKAFMGKEAWFVHSSPPLPPGAPQPDLLKAFQQRMEEYAKTMISAAVLVDAEGNVQHLKGPADFNKGLMKVSSDDEARLAAAAILSLAGGRDGAGPGAVAPKEVEITKSEKGWTCRVTRKFNFQGEVQFDAKGQVTAVSKISIMPPPP